MQNSHTASHCVNRLKVLADPTRLAVLEALMDGPMHVHQLTERIHIEQSLMSHHLKVLRDADLVQADRDGKSVRYQLAENVVSTTNTTKALNLGCCQLSFDTPNHNQDNI